MLVSVLFFGLIRAKVTEEAVKSNYSSSTFIRNIIDERLSNIQNLSYQIISNEVSLQLLNTGVDSFKTQKTYQLVNDIGNYMISNNFIDDIYLYYPKYDYVVGKQGIYQSKAYYLLQNRHNPDGYELWIKSVKNASNMKYFELENGGNSDLLFSRLAHFGKDSASNCILIIKISKQSVDNILKWSNTQEPNQFVAITDDKNRVLASNGQKELLGVIKSANKKEFKEISENYYSYKEYYIVYQPSRLKGLNYYLIKNRGYVLEIQTMITNILIISILTCMLAGILLSIYLSNKNAKPLINILQRVRMAPSGGKGINEYDLISQKIDEMFFENETAIQQIEQQQKIIYSSFVRTLLSNEYRDESAISSLSAIYGINFENPYFCVIVAQFSMNKGNNAEKPDISGITRFFDSSTNRDFALYYVDIQQHFAIIVNYDCEVAEKQKVIGDFIKSISHYCEEADMTWRYSRSDVYESSDKIYTCYHEALSKIKLNGSSLLGIDSIKQNRTDKNNNTDSSAFKIKSFIDNNYSNPILGLGYISEELGISTSYISRVFKEKYQVGAVEYINTIRIEHAKELIRQDDMNIKEIALKVGFSSDVSFIRVFKKYENITPGKYNETADINGDH
jgi:AraC-like DNA-binding protein